MKGFKLDDTGDVFINNLDKVPKEPLVFEGATTQEVIEQGKNLLDIKTFSASGSLTNPALRNNCGTTLSTTDGTLNSVTITQVPSGTNTDFTNYTNGYFNIGLENITPKRNYTISFDYEIISNPLNATKFFLMANGTGNSCYADVGATSGRTSANFYFADVAGKKYIELRLGGRSCTLSNFMVTEVGQSTEFEPYIAPSPTITNPSPLISLIHNETKTGYGVALNGIGAAKDVLTINKYTGKAEIQRKCGLIKSYNGETISTDYMSTTGELSTGAEVLYVLPEPITESVPYEEPRIKCEIEMIDGNELLVQTVESVIGTNKGEWVLNKDEGIHFKNLLGKKIDEEVIKNEVFQGLLQVDSSFFMTDFSVELDAETRKLKIHFSAVNDNGEEVEGVNVWA